MARRLGARGNNFFLLAVTYSLLVRAASRVACRPSRKMYSFKGKVFFVACEKVSGGW